MITDTRSLCEQLEKIASSLEELSAALESEQMCLCIAGDADHALGAELSLERTSIAVSRVQGDAGRPLRSSGIAFVEAVLSARERRLALLDHDLLFDPAWSMLIDLYRAELCGKLLSVTDVSIGSGVPETTALRYLRTLQERGYIERVPDKNDKRRVFVRISQPTFGAMADYFAAVEAEFLVQAGLA